MKLEIVQKLKPTDDSISLYFRKSEALVTYKAGQHALISIRINDQLFKRTYSFHTSPDIDENVGITVRAVDAGVVSHYLQTINDTADIFLDGVAGDFVVEPHQGKRRHLVMFAAGSGITPIMAMLKTILHHEPESIITVIYSNKTYAKTIFKDELANLAKKFHGRLAVYHILTQDENPAVDTPIFYKGRLSKMITKNVLKRILAEVNFRTEYYLCSPFAFMQMVEESIRGLNPDNPSIYKEHFYIPDEKCEFDASGLLTREVVLQMKDKEQLLIVPGGKTILDAARNQRMTLPHSCTEGQCGTCRAFLVSGEVKLRRNHILTQAEIKAGQILLCQSFPLSEGITIKPRL
jgi:ring-1,2-phenylacetyl-CoA epoxidase subunit PaaE